MPLDGGTELPPGAGHKVKRLNPSCFPERPQKLQKGAQVKPGAVLFTGLQQGTTAGPAFPSLVLNRLMVLLKEILHIPTLLLP